MAIGFCSDYVPIFSGDYVQGIVSCGYGLSWCRLSTYIYVFKHKYIYIYVYIIWAETSLDIPSWTSHPKSFHQPKIHWNSRYCGCLQTGCNSVASQLQSWNYRDGSTHAGCRCVVGAFDTVVELLPPKRHEAISSAPRVCFASDATRSKTRHCATWLWCGARQARGPRNCEWSFRPDAREIVDALRVQTRELLPGDDLWVCLGSQDRQSARAGCMGMDSNNKPLFLWGVLMQGKEIRSYLGEWTMI